ncbi:MAG TPA: class I SAM-dependent methyltransferase [Phycisphaerae bacterium]|nr:class I SAM-dependent methyltransferase [Phycisphaerae bacterium]
MADLLDLCAIEYLAPADAARLELPGASVDFHVSLFVFEHVPPDAVAGILAEGARVLRPGGAMVHHIDYSDHFSHSDTSISPINFLQFSDAQWAQYAGNRYMYMNRLRQDDYVEMFRSLGQRIVLARTVSNDKCLAILRRGDLPLDQRFRAKPLDTLAITSSLFVLEPAGFGAGPTEA